MSLFFSFFIWVMGGAFIWDRVMCVHWRSSWGPGKCEREREREREREGERI